MPRGTRHLARATRHKVAGSTPRALLELSDGCSDGRSRRRSCQPPFAAITAAWGLQASTAMFCARLCRLRHRLGRRGQPPPLGRRTLSLPPSLRACCSPLLGMNLKRQARAAKTCPRRCRFLRGEAGWAAPKHVAFRGEKCSLSRAKGRPHLYVVGKQRESLTERESVQGL